MQRNKTRDLILAVLSKNELLPMTPGQILPNLHRKWTSAAPAPRESDIAPILRRMAAEGILTEEIDNVDVARYRMTAPSSMGVMKPKCEHCLKELSFVRKDLDKTVYQCLNGNCQRYGVGVNVLDPRKIP